MSASPLPGLGAQPARMAVAVTDEGRVLRVTLDAPPSNVLDASIIDGLTRIFRAAPALASLRAIVIEGRGKHFSFGASVEEHRKEQAAGMIAAFAGLFRAMMECPIATFALVRGQCLGGGMELATFCNFVLAEPSAKFGQPEIRLGVFAPIAAAILPRLIGQGKTDDLMLTGRSIDAETARAWGLVHSVAADGEAALRALLQEEVLGKSGLSLRFAVRASRFLWNREVGAALGELEKLYVDDLMATSDAVEGIEAFIARRPPVWKDV